jgi:hypothetical protein
MYDGGCGCIDSGRRTVLSQTEVYWPRLLRAGNSENVLRVEISVLKVESKKGLEETGLAWIYEGREILVQITYIKQLERGECAVCPQSPLGVLKNCVAQTN